MRCFCAWTRPSTALTHASARNHQGASVGGLPQVCVRVLLTDGIWDCLHAAAHRPDSGMLGRTLWKKVVHGIESDTAVTATTCMLACSLYLGRNRFTCVCFENFSGSPAIRCRSCSPSLA